MELKLPPVLASRGDLNRILRELNRVNDYLVGAGYRGEDMAVVSQNLSPPLSELLALNNCNLADEGQRRMLYDSLEAISQQAPTLHISFNTAPSPKSLEQVLLWLRANIHPQVLLSVGLQPSIAAGCILRTPNRVIDMGLKQTLLKKQPLLLEMIKGENHD